MLGNNKNNKKIEYDYLAVIPARSGSKRIKNKNLRNFLGKPLIYWTLIVAQKIRKIQFLCVSSDSKKILFVARKYGIKNLILRPKNISDDYTSSWDVVKHAINHFKKKNLYFKNVILLQPTSPQRTKKNINDAISYFEKNKLNGLISVNRIEKPLEWMFSSHKKIIFSDKKKYDKFHKKNKKFYDVVPNGAIYIFKKDIIYKKNFIYRKKVEGFLTKNKSLVDIDNYNDLKLAEYYAQKKK